MNETWVNEHRASLNPNDPNVTFQYVVRHHPNFGMAEPFDVMIQIPFRDVKTMPDVLALSKYADAVTVCCFEKLGNVDPQPKLDLLTFDDVNLTSVANCAYLAQHHSNAEVRLAYEMVLNAFVVRTH